MTRKKLAATVAAVLAFDVAGPVPAFAHHSSAMFDMSEEARLTLDAVVREWEYVNPHSWLYVDVTAEDGTVTTWGLEWEAPARLRRVNVGPSFFEPGQELSVQVAPLKDGRPAGSFRGATLSDGTVVDR